MSGRSHRHLALSGVSPVGWRRQRRVRPDAPHRKGPAMPGTNTGNNALPHKKRGGKLRPVVASATEPGTCLFPSGPRRRERCCLCLLKDGGGWRPTRGSQHTEVATAATVSPTVPCVVPFFGRVRRTRCSCCRSGRLPVLFPCAGGQRRCRWVAQAKTPGVPIPAVARGLVLAGQTGPSF